MSDEERQDLSDRLLEQHLKIGNLEGLVGNRNRELAAERKRSAELVAWVKRAEDEGFSALARYLSIENPSYSMVFDTSDVDPSDFAICWAGNLRHAVAEYERSKREQLQHLDGLATEAKDANLGT